MDFKPITSKTVESEIIPFGTLNPNFNGYNEVTGSALKFTVAQRNPNNGRPFSNLYSSFGLPAANFEVNGWDLEWGANALQDIDDATNVVVIEIPKNTYGELIDGRTIKLTLPHVTGGTFDCYSSYYLPWDASSDPSVEAERFGHPSVLNQNLTPAVDTPSTNVSFLFADGFGRPVTNPTTSWSDGYTTTSPPAGYPDSTTYFSFAQDKQVATATDAGSGVDRPIGVCYLDKGFIVLTSSAVTQNINWSASTAATCIPAGTGCTGTTYVYSAITQASFSSSDAQVTFYSFEKQWVLDVLCTASGNEFYLTKNPTAAPLNPIITNGEYDLGSVNKPVYITAIGLYDDNGDMLAIAKPDRPIEKYKANSSYFNLKFRF